MTARASRIFIMFALIGAFLIVFGLSEQPGFTDAFYHYNAAVQIVEGKGFTDPYLWTYIGAPAVLPAPSHLYWMPGTSVIAAAGMLLFGSGFRAAQIGFALCLWGAALAAYWLGLRDGTVRRAWSAGILTLVGGFYMRFWGQTDTFAPYAVVGALTLIWIGLGAETGRYRWWAAAGICAGLGHLIRSDGLLLLLVGWVVILYPFRAMRSRWMILAIFTFCYAATMTPWFLRNYNQIGSLLPVGGMQGAWFREYNDLFNFPPDASMETLFADGGQLFIETRLWALFSNEGVLIHFMSVQGYIIFAPFIIVALWRRRSATFWQPVLVFAAGIHLAFALVFPFPGVRGGLFHAAAALVPIWSALGLAGLDEAVEWISRRRRSWNPRVAKPVFASSFLLIVIMLSLSISIPARFTQRDPALYDALGEQIPDSARVMINDPAQLYYYTGISAVPVPNEAPEVMLEIADLYQIDYLILEEGGIPTPMQFEEAPAFLISQDFAISGVGLYAIIRD